MAQQVLHGKKIDTSGAIILALMVSFIVLVYSSFSMGVMLTIGLVIVGIALETLSLHGIERGYGIKLLYYIFAVYLISSVFFSYAFRDGQYYLTSDCLHYFRLLNMTTMNIDPSGRVYSCYVLLDDSDGLHEVFVRYCILFANSYLNGASVIYLTITNVFFGVLASAPIYRILLTATTPDKAYKYALLFGLLSPFHFYSVDFVRDIVIAFLYAHALEILIGKFKPRNLLILIILFLLAWGVRLYSGLFLLAFILYYVFKPMATKPGVRVFAMILFVVLVVSAVPLVLKSDIYIQSSEELELYAEYNKYRMTGGSLTASLEKLPPVAREVSLCIYSIIMPFPSFLAIGKANSLEQFYMSSVLAIYAMYMYFMMLGLLIMLFVGKYYKRLKLETDWLLLIMFAIYIVINLSHPDTRRLMAMFPILLLYYVKSKEYCKQTGYNLLAMTQSLTGVYVILSAVYLVIKG